MWLDQCEDNTILKWFGKSLPKQQSILVKQLLSAKTHTVQQLITVGTPPVPVKDFDTCTLKRQKFCCYAAHKRVLAPYKNFH